MVVRRGVMVWLVGLPLIACGARSGLVWEDDTADTADGGVEQGAARDASIDDAGEILPKCDPPSTPTILATATQASFYGIAVDAYWVYWTTTTELHRVSKCGGVPEVVDQYAQASYPQRPSVAQGVAVWGSNGASFFGDVRRIDLPADATTLVTTTSDELWGATTDGTTVFWLQNPRESSTAGGIWSMPAAGGTPTRLAPVGAAGYVGPLAVSDRYVCWITGGDDPAGDLLCVAKTGGAVHTVTESDVPNDMVIDGAHILVAPRPGAFVSVVEYDIGTGDRTVVVPDQSIASALAVDATSIYWAAYAPNGVESSVNAQKKTGGAPIVLATGQADTRSIVVDGTAAYWMNNSDGTIMKMRTP